MKKLQALAQHLVSKQLVKREQIAGWVDTATIKAAGTTDENGLKFGDIHYDAVLTLERLNSNNALLLFALLTAWLVDNDDNRGDYRLKTPEFQIDIDDDDGLADVVMTIEFVEPLYLVPVDGGRVEMKGISYDFGSFSFDIAETVKVSDGQLAT